MNSMSKKYYIKRFFRINNEIYKTISVMKLQDEKNTIEQEKNSKDKKELNLKENYIIESNKKNLNENLNNSISTNTNSSFQKSKSNIENNSNDNIINKQFEKNNFLFSFPSQNYNMNLLNNNIFKYDNLFNPVYNNFKINNFIPGMFSLKKNNFMNFNYNNNFNYNFYQYDYNNKFQLKKKIKNLDSPRNKINLENILRKKDKRTTIMIRHIPNKYSLKLLIDDINENFKDKYNLIYLPIDNVNCCNLGFGFINFTNIFHILGFYDYYFGKKWKKFNSDKKCELAYSKIQGKDELLKYIQQSENYNNEKKIPIYYLNDNIIYEGNICLPLKYFHPFLNFYPYSSYHLLDNGNFIVDSFYNF